MKRFAVLAATFVALTTVSSALPVAALTFPAGAPTKAQGTDPGGYSTTIVYSQPAHQQNYDYTWQQRSSANGAYISNPVYCRTSPPISIYWQDPIFDTLLAYLRSHYSPTYWSFSRGNRGTRPQLKLVTYGPTPFDSPTPSGSSSPATPGSGMQFVIDHTRSLGPYASEEYITLERVYSRQAGSGTSAFVLAWQETLGSPFVSWSGPRTMFNGTTYPDSTAIYPRCGNNMGVNLAVTQYTIVDDIFPVTHYWDQYGYHSVVIHGGFRIQNVSKLNQQDPYPPFYPSQYFLF